MAFFKRRKEWLLLGIILALGLWVRVYRLGEVPVGFFCDEASRGVDAYWLLKSGVDSHGETWPLFFRALGEYTLPLQIYSMIPWVALMGLTEVAVRMTSVVWGMMAIVGVYLVGKESEKLIVNNEKRKDKGETKRFRMKNLGLWAALIMAIEPWAIHYSRMGIEYTSFLSWYIWGWWVTFKAVKDRRWLLIWGVVWGISLYSYNGALIVVPITVCLLGTWLFVVGLRRKELKWWLWGIGLFLVFAYPAIDHLLFGGGLNRWKQVGITEHATAKELVDRVVRQYGHQLSWSFFVGKGEDTFITRHFTGGLLPLLKIQMGFILLGLGLVVWKIKEYWWILVWLGVYPVVGALGDGGPFTSRSIIGAPLAALLTGIGIAIVFWLVRRWGKWMEWGMRGFVLVGLGWSFLGFWGFYMNEYSLKSADFWGWQYGPREIVSYFKSVSGQYDELVMSHEFNAPEIFFKFYDPERVCKGCMIGDVGRFDPSKKQLFALSSKQLEDVGKAGLVMKVQKVINYPNGQVAFEIGELQSRIEDRR